MMFATKLKSPKIKNKNTGTFPYFIHCPGKLDPPDMWLILKSFFESCKPNFYQKSFDNITVITWNSSQDKSILEKSCEYFGIKYVSLGKGTSWNNIMKLSCSLDFARNCSTKYILGIDGYDAVAVRSLDFGLESLLERKKARLIFNSTYSESFPYISNLYPSDYKLNRLNAGAWIGETCFIKEFFEYCLRLKESDHLIYKNVISTKMKHDPKNSDQTLIKVAGFDFVKDIELDDNCEIFNLLSRPASSENPNNSLVWKQNLKLA